MTIDHYVHRFYAYLLTEKRVSQNTFNAYRSDIEQLIAFMKQGSYTTLEEITYQQLHVFLTHLYEKNISARSVVRKISAIKLFFRYAQERFQIPNPALGLPLPKMERKLPQFLTEDEVEALLQYVDTHTGPTALRTKVIVYTLYTAGLRVSELVNLTVSDIFFDRHYLIVKGKGGKQRMIPMPPVLILLLQQWIMQPACNTTTTALQKQAASYVLYNQDHRGIKKPLTRQYIWSVIKKVWHATGNTKNISPHTLRHSFATHFLKNGVHLRSLQVILGHENIATVEIYTHIETSYLTMLYNKKHPRS